MLVEFVGGLVVVALAGDFCEGAVHALDLAVSLLVRLDFGQGVDDIVLAVNQLLGKTGAAWSEDEVLDDVRFQVRALAARHPFEVLPVEIIAACFDVPAN